MRLGVLDVGSNTVHLLVVDAHRGGRPDPVRSVKSELHLAELLQADGALGEHGTDVLVTAALQSRQVAESEGVDDLVAFATSAVRDATDSAQVLAAVKARAGVELQVLPGADEARLTFLAVRRWFGWSAGRLLCLDIGGGSLEIAGGLHEEPDVAVSLPLGAGRLTRDLLGEVDPPRKRSIGALRQHVQDTLAEHAAVILAEGPADLGVATSKTFRSLARLSGAAPYSDGPLVSRRLTLDDLGSTVDRLAGMRADERARLPGVSPHRAPQLLAGSIVAHETMRALKVQEVEICPWALREGVILRRLDWIDGA